MPPVPGRLSPAKNILYGTLVATVLLLTVEALARLGATILSDLRQKRPELSVSGFAPSRTYGWVRKPGFSGIAAETHRREFDANGFFAFDTKQITDGSRPKVVCIGDSNTFGLDVPSAACFPEVADRLLPEVDVINLGVPGYSSYHGVLVAREYLARFNPALVVVSFNFNDRRWVPNADQKDAPARLEAVYFSDPDRLFNRLQRACNYSYVFRGIRRVAHTFTGRAPPGSRIRVRLDQTAPRVDLESYRSNLREIARLTREHGSQLLFVVLHDRPDQSKPLAEAIRLIETGQPAGAVPILEAMIDEQRWYEDIASIHLADAYRALGREEKIDALLWREVPPLLSDGRHPIRVDTDYNRVMREVAAEFGAPCLEAGDALDANNEYFSDTCHFGVQGHQLVGELLAREAAALLETPIRASPSSLETTDVPASAPSESAPQPQHHG